MKDKFIFFDLKRNFIVNILIVIEVALWIFYTGALVSLFKFESSYKNRYNRSIPINNAEVMTFYKMGISGKYYENKEVFDNYIKDSLKLIEDNGYTYGFVQKQENESFPFEVFGFDPKQLHGNLTEMDKDLEKASAIGFNYGMIENYKNNIIGEISKDDWVRNDNFIPVIVGSEIGSKVNIGQTYMYNDVTYKIIGKFKKDILAFDYTNVVDSSFLLNKSFVIPVSEEKFFENFQYEPITIFFNGDKQTNYEELNKSINEITEDIVISNFEDELNKFFGELKSKRYYAVCRIIVISIIASASIVTTISYKINEEKDKIGILYSIGITKKNIFKIFCLEFFTNILIGVIGGSLFYLRNCSSVYSFFINENLLSNLYISIMILLVIVLMIMISGFSQINKLTPKEMMGGFGE